MVRAKNADCKNAESGLTRFRLSQINITKWEDDMNKFAAFVIVVIVLVSVTSAGCINMLRNNPGQPGSSGDNGEPGFPAESSSPLPAASPAIVPVAEQLFQASTADLADPIYPADYYRTIRNLSGKNGERSSLPVENSWSTRIPLYTLHTSPLFNASAFQVNVTRCPLVIIFEAAPKKGGPRISFAEMTVRELPSKKIVAEERIDHFTDGNPDPGSTATGTESGASNVRQVVIFKEGSYHINVYGNQVDAGVTVFTGDSPYLADTIEKVPTAVSPGLSEEEEVWA
jgi:hypothetical protein